MNDAARSAARALLRRVAPGGFILCYHGVASPAHPSEGIANVGADELLAAIDTVRRHCDIVPLAALLERHASGAATAGLVALTFDDAYASLGAMLPELVGRRVPSTIFVTTGASAAGARFWWDRIDDLFPRVAAGRWRAFEDELGLPSSFRYGQDAAYGPLRPLRQWLLAEHRGRWPARLEPPLASLEAESGIATTQRAMTFDEIADALASPLVDAAVHTRTHPVLPLLGDAEMLDEIGGAHAELRARLPRVLPVLAAPFGLVDARTVRLARQAGMTATLGLAARPLPHRGADAPLPRLAMTRGLTSSRLTMHLAGIVDLVRRVTGRQDPVYPALPSPTS